MIFAFEQIFFYLLLFAIPFQTRIILWQQNWYFNEWQTASVYFTDILLLLLFGFWRLGRFSKSRQTFNLSRSISAVSSMLNGLGQVFKSEFPNKFRHLIPNFKNPDLYLVIFVLISAISIKNAQSTPLGLFTVVKLIEFALFYFYIKYYALLKFDVFYSLLVLFAGGLFQSIIAILQFVSQSSVGLGLQIFGEGFLKPEMSGVAVFLNNIGQKVMRSYGTTPHPNILAGYLFLSIFSFIAWYFYSKSRYSRNIEWAFLSLWSIVLFAFFTTFSRTVIFIALAGLCFRAAFLFFKGKSEINEAPRGKPRGILSGILPKPSCCVASYFAEQRNTLLRSARGRASEGLFSLSPSSPQQVAGYSAKENKILKLKIRNIMLALLITTFIFSIFYSQEILSRLSLSLDDEAVVFRIYYGKSALNSAVNWFGVGAGNFVNWFMIHEPYQPKWFYQPVHNIYLLIYSETGLIGLIAFGLFLVMTVFNFIQKNRFQLASMSIFMVFLSFLFIGFFDHFLWTLQQGRFMFWLVAALLNLQYLNKIHQNE